MRRRAHREGQSRLGPRQPTANPHSTFGVFKECETSRRAAAVRYFSSVWTLDLLTKHVPSLPLRRRLRKDDILLAGWLAERSRAAPTGAWQEVKRQGSTRGSEGEEEERGVTAHPTEVRVRLSVSVAASHADVTPPSPPPLRYLRSFSDVLCNTPSLSPPSSPVGTPVGLASPCAAASSPRLLPLPFMFGRFEPSTPTHQSPADLSPALPCLTFIYLGLFCPDDQPLPALLASPRFARSLACSVMKQNRQRYRRYLSV
ncbi:hypothetical protein O3P69_016734 [Scylla paramamosain]|uniref:Uncharacterized protein n=1 Tax=Scylla paramamosain TaxID=85552 RepID=A0AAW0T096_SCYPA